ncbi:glycosyltransferase [Butyrivibrio sp. AD3002]|uniref:glycosyltransferase n=1 Tax=Butyrivibrio sp. AD3002 TaxID=1280670 RepID=UPI0003B75923|nr:glycosyltransferase [Butyrivibrio sp. AD3002]
MLKVFGLLITIIKAINITNFKFLADAFKKGGFKQIVYEMHAYKLRLQGFSEPIHIPEIVDKTKHKSFKNLEEIVFEKRENPLVSIIIPVYNQFNFTYNCLYSIKKNSGNISYEIIIADDVSTDNTVNLAEKVKNINIIRNQENLRFLKNCNNAAKQARGKYILFLNNDTQVMKNWLAPLVKLLEEDDKIGLVGSKLIYPTGELQEAGGIVWRDASAWNYGNGQNPERAEYNYVKETDFISGASICTRKTLWQELGGFDELLAPAYYEDVDYAFSVRKAGFKVVYQPLSVVAHFEGKSNGTDTSTGLKAYQVTNQGKFYEKWKDVLEKEHFDNGTNVFIARDRSRNKKHLLLIDHYIPKYDMDSGSKCTFMYLEQFEKMGMQVTFIGDNFAPDEPYRTELTQQGIEILCGSHYMKHWEEWLSINGKYFDYAYTQRPHIAPKYIDAIRKYTNAKLFYFDVDLVHLREQREYEISHDIKLKESSEKWKKIEFEIFDTADVIHVVGSYEEEYLKKLLPDKKIRNIPIFIYTDEKSNIEKDFAKREDILFVGGFAHPPNLDAVMWFAKEIFPGIVKKYPSIRWHIVGSKPPEELMKLASDNIIIDGFLSDEELEELYRSCRIAVVPLRYGAGVKGKVVEAAYYQIPMITTPIGAEGIPDDMDTMIVKESAEDIMNAICDLYEDYERLRKMSDNGKAFIQKHYSLSAVRDVLSMDMDI